MVEEKEDEEEDDEFDAEEEKEDEKEDEDITEDDDEGGSDPPEFEPLTLLTKKDWESHRNSPYLKKHSRRRLQLVKTSFRDHSNLFWLYIEVSFLRMLVVSFIFYRKRRASRSVSKSAWGCIQNEAQNTHAMAKIAIILFQKYNCDSLLHLAKF